MHSPVLALPGAASLLLSPAAQAIAAQVFARKAAWWNPGSAYIAAQLGYTPANKAGDTFTGAIATPSVAINGGTALTTSNQTGTGSLVLQTSPTLTTPVIGVASGTTLTLYGPVLKTVNQDTSVAGAGATDVFRFLDAAAAVQNGSVSGHFYIHAVDNSTGANQAQYIYTFTSSSNTTADAILTQVSRHVRGTDPGTSATPFSVLADGVGGAMKIQFTKSAIAQVNLKVLFVGLITG